MTEREAENLTAQQHRLPRLLVVLLFTAFYALFDWSLGSAVIFGLAVLAMLSMAWERGGDVKLRLTEFHVWLLVLAGFCLLSSIWAWDTDNAITKAKTVFSMFLCYWLLWLCCQEFDSPEPMLKAVLWGGNLIMLYIFAVFGVRGILNLLKYDDRLSEQFFLNSNVVGVLCAMSAEVNFYFLLKDRRLRWWNAFLPVAVLMVSATGSRQALAVMAGGLALLYFLFILRGKSPAEVSVLFLVGIALLILLLVMIATLPAFSGIYKRMTSLFAAVTGVGRSDRSARTRLHMMEIAVDQLHRTPLLGIGMGSGHVLNWKYLNKTFYLHNNYAELLAGGGLCGTAIYYFFHVWLLLQFIRYRRYGDLETSVCVAMLVMVLVEDYASVTYYEKDNYFYLMIGMLEVERLRRRCRAAVPMVPTLREKLPHGTLAASLAAGKPVGIGAGKTESIPAALPLLRDRKPDRTGAEA